MIISSETALEQHLNTAPQWRYGGSGEKKKSLKFCFFMRLHCPLSLSLSLSFSLYLTSLVKRTIVRCVESLIRKCFISRLRVSSSFITACNLHWDSLIRLFPLLLLMMKILLRNLCRTYGREEKEREVGGKQ